MESYIKDVSDITYKVRTYPALSIQEYFFKVIKGGIDSVRQLMFAYAP